MTLGVGGSTAEIELERLSAIKVTAEPLAALEFERRLAKARALMKQNDYEAMYLSAGSGLFYFTGTKWHLTERMVGAVILPAGSVEYLLPAFEKETFSQYMVIEGNLNLWQEHESPFELFHSILQSHGISTGKIGIDEATPYHHFGEISQLESNYQYADARPVTAGCRARKSESEISLMQLAMDMTLEVHKSAARILREGISTTEVANFIHRGHKAIGSAGGSTWL